MARNMDGGHSETERILKELEARITKEYEIAEREIQEKLDDYLRRFKIKDELKRKALANGLITQAEYDQWRIGQIMVGQRWAEMRDNIAVDLTKTAQIAKQIAFLSMPDVYALNFNYNSYMIDVLSGGRLGTSFTLYSRDAVAVLFKEGQFWHGPGRKITKLINEGKQLAWDKKQIQSVMMQGIVQGESIPKLATRLATTVGDSDRKAAIRNARTMATGVQNAGRCDSIRRANDIGGKYGLQVLKQWCATLDGRTRHWHAELDGEAIPEKDYFVNEYGEIYEPGDPGAEPANIYNCRCTLLPCIEGLGFNNSLHPDVTGRELGKDLDGISYEDWKAGQYEQHSDSITKQDEIAELMKWHYNEEYRNYRNLTGTTSHGTILKQNKDAEIPPSYNGDFSDFNPLDLSEQEKTALSTLHDLSMNEGYEYGIAIKDGVVSEPFTSFMSDKVKVPDEHYIGNAIDLLHSHTNSTPLSAADLEKFTRENIRSVSVSTINGDVFKVIGYHITKDEFDEVVADISKEVDFELMFSEEFQGMTYKQRNYMAIRETFFRVCRYFGWEMQGGRLK